MTTKKLLVQTQISAPFHHLPVKALIVLHSTVLGINWGVCGTGGRGNIDQNDQDYNFVHNRADLSGKAEECDDPVVLAHPLPPPS